MWRGSRSALVLMFDVLCLAAGPSLALLVISNFEIANLPRSLLTVTAGYTGLSAAVGGLVFGVMGLHRGVLRYVSLPDFMRVAAAVTIAVLVTLFIGFTINRLDSLPRSMPIIQWLGAVAAMTGLRLIARLALSRGATPEAAMFATEPDVRHVLVVGLNRVAELYLRSIIDLGGRQLEVAGILDEDPSNINRMVRGVPIIGAPAALPQLLRQLHVHGVEVDRVVVTVPLSALSEEGRQALLELEQCGEVVLEFLAERLGLGSVATAAEADDPAPRPADRISALAHTAGLDPALGGYAYLKRAIDITSAAALVAVLSPFILLTALLVAMDVGQPILFWQQRPGRSGWPFRVYKFRTMRAGHDAEGKRIADEMRSSLVGRFLRRTRLDELPQLFNVLAGEMSFIGPWPLLPVDQPAARELRLLLRPGVTGWAQVNGGRELSPEDKNALDLWYIRNASLLLDLQIVFRTLWVALAGERTNPKAVEQARREMTSLAARRVLEVESGLSQAG